MVALNELIRREPGARQVLESVRQVAVAVYGDQSVEQPAFAAALENVAAGLWRIQQESLGLADVSPFPNA